MPAPLLLIDGYNLIYAARMAPQADTVGALQRSREQLLQFLGDRLTDAERIRAMVVFDARDPPPNRPATLCVRGVRVIFALPEGDADLILERLIGEQHSRHVTVVSSDRRVQSSARSGRVRFISSQSFLDRLGRRRVKDTPGIRDPKEHGLSPAEAQAWMQAFGAIDVALPVDSPTFADQPESISPPPSAVEPTTNSSAAAGSSPSSRKATRSRRRSPEPESRPPVDNLQYWLGVFGHLDHARLEDLL